ncbi:hypothetical protein EJV47_22880 [Hymenobacter gummosus]|uniref:Uncharacterized protein n=1 Tax=Hymenobacter gummosus TaxID=1776032 RepID=A0A3S0JB11_9BACT|nr:hypothetical protein [Hymenobacter gummosus]RTQ46007.1 hypothetical protein EJV47_22880 [Hymenobacter gummosus]
MKILVETVNQEPFHSVTKQDISVVIRNIPQDWLGSAHVFLISAQKIGNSGFGRLAFLNQTTFRVLSRGQDKYEVIKELLIEIAINATRTILRYGHKIDHEQRKKLERIIQPCYEKILLELPSTNQ